MSKFRINFHKVFYTKTGSSRLSRSIEFMVICMSLILLTSLKGILPNKNFAFTQLLQVTFESNEEGTDYRTNTFDDGASDVWARTNNASGPNNNTTTYSNLQGSFYFSGEDIDDGLNPLGGGADGYIMLKTLDVSAYQGGTIQVKAFLGGNTATKHRYRTDDYLKLRYAFDSDIAIGANSIGGLPSVANLNSGTYTTFGAFYGTGDQIATVTSSALINDADLDGDADYLGRVGVPATDTYTADSLKNALAEWTFTFNVGATDTKVSILIQAATDAGSNEIAVDHITVSAEEGVVAIAPTVTTTSASSVTATTAILGGNVTADGGATVSERGIVWSITDMTPEIGEAGVTKDAHSGTGTGVFSETISSLPANKTIYFNAYATNSVGTSYGTVSSFTSSQAALALTVFLEGPYGTTSMSTTLNGSALPTAQPYSSATAETSSAIPGTAVDWIEIELRTGTAANTKVGTNRAGFVLSNGSVVDKDGNAFTMPDADGTSYYIVIRHRNHLPIMSANAIAISSDIYTHNFTTSQGQSFGATPMIEVSSGVFAMPAGDADNDGEVDANDLTAWRNENGKTYSYGSNGKTDLNLDGTINAVDRNGFQQKNSGKSTNVPL